MGYTKQKKRLLENLIKEREVGFMELLSGGDPVVLTKEEELEDEVKKLIEEILRKIGNKSN